ncbi:MAG TPA: 4a-hydroxytetrahydrobiopterin dehydratase [Candidatus Paceibacterota bacterium]|jgi:4a-hydroxytetrahydrobiopterin dehydratase|nr:4a-hydroxytetrahydrobiopterin dehydratase [Candidatus Paceibacterota bacterium]
MANNLLKKKCIPCEKKGIKPFDRAEAEDYLVQTSGWALDKDAKKISKEFKFQDFIGAINFVERVADIAEMEGHHPDIHIYYNKVLLELWTHAIGGLSENDFIVAAKVDAHN